MCNESKDFKSIEEQCDVVIKERKLKTSKFNGEKELKKELSEKNYFDLVNGLEDIINTGSGNKYYGKYDVFDLISLYNLNSDLGLLIFSVIKKFEIKLKTSIAYNFTAEYQNWDCYLDKNNYKLITKNDIDEVYLAYNGYSRNYKGSNPKVNKQKILPFFDKDVFTSLKRREQFMSAYQNKPPLWIAIKVLSFGQLHLMFSLLNSKIATEVLKSFNMGSNERNQFESILYVVNWLRNECAHFEMINHSTYHGKYPINKELIKKLGFRKNKTRNLNLFQCMCILNYVQPLKEVVYNLFEKSPISSELKRKYLKYIGYWRQSKWKLDY